MSEKKCTHGVRRRECSICCPAGAFQKYIRDAKRREIPFELTLEQFTALVQGNCHYCTRKTACGIDRRDNSKGYSLENCVPCCRRCNDAKHTTSESDFTDWLTEAGNAMSEQETRGEFVALEETKK